MIASAALALLPACGTGDDDLTRARTTSESSTAQEPTSEEFSPDTRTAAALPFPAKPVRQAARNKGEWDLVFTDVRVAEHETFDRIVLEFRGIGIPGWSVSYVDEAVLDGSGKTVGLGGDAILDIYASGTTWPGSGYYSGPSRIEPQNGGAVDEGYFGGTFEGYTQVFVGIEGNPAPFRVFALTDPARLVIDIDSFK